MLVAVLIVQSVLLSECSETISQTKLLNNLCEQLDG